MTCISPLETPDMPTDSRYSRYCLNTCLNTCFPVSTLGVSTPVLLSQHLTLNADRCINVKPRPLVCHERRGQGTGPGPLPGHAHAHHASQVITNLLDWSKLQADQLSLPRDQPFDLETLGARSLGSHTQGRPARPLRPVARSR